jgi:hypothetical protein
MRHDDPFPTGAIGDSVTNPSIARSLNAIAASPGTQNNDRFAPGAAVPDVGFLK